MNKKLILGMLLIAGSSVNAMTNRERALRARDEISAKQRSRQAYNKVSSSFESRYGIPTDQEQDISENQWKALQKALKKLKSSYNAKKNALYLKYPHAENPHNLY